MDGRGVQGRPALDELTPADREFLEHVGVVSETNIAVAAQPPEAINRGDAIKAAHALFGDLTPAEQYAPKAAQHLHEVAQSIMNGDREPLRSLINNNLKLAPVSDYESIVSQLVLDGGWLKARSPYGYLHVAAPRILNREGGHGFKLSQEFMSRGTRTEGGVTVGLHRGISLDKTGDLRVPSGATLGVEPEQEGWVTGRSSRRVGASEWDHQVIGYYFVDDSLVSDLVPFRRPHKDFGGRLVLDYLSPRTTFDWRKIAERAGLDRDCAALLVAKADPANGYSLSRAAGSLGWLEPKAEAVWKRILRKRGKIAKAMKTWQ